MKLISDEFIEEWLRNRLGEGNRFEQFNRKFCQDLAQAQLQQDREVVKRIIKWLNKPCREHYHGIQTSYLLRKYCQTVLPLVLNTLSFFQATFNTSDRLLFVDCTCRAHIATIDFDYFYLR